jgi:hypothetical protein
MPSITPVDWKSQVTERPAARRMNPGVARLAGDQRGDGEGERHREAHIAEVEHGRVDGHGGILQQRVQTLPSWNGVMAPSCDNILKGLTTKLFRSRKKVCTTMSTPTT